MAKTPTLICPVVNKRVKLEDIQRNDGRCPLCNQVHLDETDFHPPEAKEIHPAALEPVRPERLAALADQEARLKLAALPTSNPFTISRGGILLLNGKPVKQEPVPFHSSQGWVANGAPVIGTLEHFQAGCGDPFAAFMDRQVSAHLSVQRGDVFPVPMIQFVSCNLISFHAFSAAFHYIGIESAVLPGSCDWSVAMLETMAAVTAAILNWAERVFNVTIASKRSPGGAFTPGIKCHADGLAPNASWDPNDHWDAPWKATGDQISQWVSSSQKTALDRSPWTAVQFTNRVADWRDDMPALSKEQQAALDLIAGADQKALKQLLASADDIVWLSQVHNGAKAAAEGKKAPNTGTTARLGYDVKKAQLAGKLG